jgi:feruloyl-CoA synthase
MITTPRYRHVDFGIDSVTVQKTSAGGVLVRTTQQLQAYPQRMTDRLRHWAQHAPDRSFLAKRDASGTWRHVSYAQALQAARHIGQGLLNRGLSADRPILILSENDLEHALLAMACQYVGVPYSPVSPAYSLISRDYGKLKHIVDHLTPGLVFASDGAKYAAAVRAVLPNGVEFVVTQGVSENSAATPFRDLESTPVTDAVEAAHAATGPDSIAKFLFTSGSTKMPKAVINTQRMMCSNIQMMLQVWPFLGEEPPVLVDWLPWNHTFGGNHNFNAVLYNGGTLYIDDGKPTPQLIGETLRNLKEIAPTIYFNVPKGWEEIANALESDEALCRNFYSRLKLQYYAGAGLSQTVWDKLHKSAQAFCGERIIMSSGLGMTETAPGCLWVVEENVRAGQLGIPSPGIDIKLVPNGEKLEIRYRGPNVTPGYWRDPRQTSDAFDDEGFFCSGDAVKWLNEDDPNAGFVFDGRVAEDFKLYTGTWVSVGPLRARVIQEGAPYVQDCVVTGHDRAEVGLLIIPQVEMCRKLAGLPAQATTTDVLASGPVQDFFKQLISRLHDQGTGSANRVTRALLLSQPPSIDLGEITDKGSINQRAILLHRAALVEALYADADPAIIKPLTQVA